MRGRCHSAQRGGTCRRWCRSGTSLTRLHRKLKVRPSANSGQTLSDYLLAELERLAVRPTRDEMLARIHSRTRVTLKTPAAAAIRQERECGVIVVDASALLEFLLQTPLGARVEVRFFRDDDELHVPHLVDVEVVQALRRLVRMGEVSSGRTNNAIADLTTLIFIGTPHLDFLGRAWKLQTTQRLRRDVHHPRRGN